MSNATKNHAAEQVEVDNIIMRSTELLNKAWADAAKNNERFKNLELVHYSHGGPTEALTLYFEFRNKHTKEIRHDVNPHAIEFADAIIKRAADWGFEPHNGAALLDTVWPETKRLVRFGIYGDNQRTTEYNILGWASEYRNPAASCDVGGARRLD